MPRLIAIVALLHAYVGWRIVPDLPWAVAGTWLTAGWLCVSLLLMSSAWLARRGHRDRRADVLAWAGLLAGGLFSSLFVLTLLRDVALGIVALWNALSMHPIAFDSVREESATVVVLLAIVFTLVGLVNARRLARVRPVDVAIEGLPRALHGFLIAQISDVHVGATIKRAYVAAIVDAVNALMPDMIAVTGDLVDGSVRDLSPHTQPLSRLAARHGSYFVTGNHEYYSGAHAWVSELRRLGLRVLMNEHVVLEHEGASVVVAGVTDYGAHHFDASHRSDPGKSIAGAPADAGVKVLLAHQPRSAFAAAEHGFDLQLSGHTHGGQFLPWNFFVRLQQPFTAGLHRLKHLWVYTSRGTGYWGPPKRLGAPSEITLVRLVCAEG
ncbi:MAG: metallophosphoesterase [Pseudomonadota bacterium]|nr:metallophosphoesterase [Pseudomonadota bacterium]